MLVQDLIKQAWAEHQAGRLAGAKHIYEQVLAVEPRQPDALNLLGVITLQGGDAEGAVTLFERAVQVHPSNPGFHANLAQAYIAAKRTGDALAAFRRVAELDPRNPQFAVGIAICLAMQGDAAEAERQLRSILLDHPEFSLAWYNLGNLLRDAGRLREAADIYRRVIELEPAFADAYCDLGQVLHQGEHFDDAEQAYRRHLALQPESAAGYVNLASLLIDRGRPADAVTICRQGIDRLHGAAPSDLRWMLGSAFAHQGKFTAALAEFRAAATAVPSNVRALWGYALALLETGNKDKGLAWLEHALGLDADSPELRYAIAGVYLSLGDLQAGWREYEWRPARARFVEKFSDLRLAREAPAGLSGGRICLLREQGLGDELFFLRFAAALKPRGAEITYRANAKIASMLERVPMLDRVIASDDSLPAADCALLVGDLPHALGRLESSPHRHQTSSPCQQPGEPQSPSMGLPRRLQVFYPEIPAPLTLPPLPRKLQEMKHVLAGLGPPPYLGLTWRAGTVPEQQRGAVWVLHKEIPLQGLGAAVRGVNGTLLALQRNPQPGEIEHLAELAGKPAHDLTPLNEDLEAMLALLALADEYIGVSNTNMHLRAGAGRTGRVLVPRPAEWRWMNSGEESPWFPGFSIYRQDVDGGWDSAFDRLRTELSRQFGASQ